MVEDFELTWKLDAVYVKAQRVDRVESARMRMNLDGVATTPVQEKIASRPGRRAIARNNSIQFAHTVGEESHARVVFANLA